MEKLMNHPRALRAVFGMSLGEFQALVSLMEQVWLDVLKKRPDRQRAVGGGAKGKLKGAQNKLCFILFYLKVYRTFDVMSAFFDLDRSECCRWTRKLLPVLEKVLARKLVLPERRIRPVAEFAAAFPGVREDGMERRIGLLSRSKRGARHDQRIADRHGIIQRLPAQVSVIADTGFQGRRDPVRCLPRKGRKRRPLSREDRGWNRLGSSIRIRVEHAIGGMKRLAAVSGIYRNRKAFCDDLFNLLAAGLWNLHLSLKAA